MVALEAHRSGVQPRTLSPRKSASVSINTPTPRSISLAICLSKVAVPEPVLVGLEADWVLGSPGSQIQSALLPQSQ